MAVTDDASAGPTGVASVGAVRPFRIEVPDETLDDLQRRLNAARGVSFPLDEPALGIDLAVLARVLAHWRDGFDWRRVERELNRFDHVLVEVDGMDVHAVHRRGEGPRPLPVIIGHGWPSSFAEVLPVVELLTRPAEFGGDPADAFDVIVPSLPGYVFSAPPLALVDATAASIARRWHGLMGALGYDRYGASGGDVGARVAAWMAAQEPQAVLGLHLSCNAISSPEIEADTVLSDEERAWLARDERWWETEGAYLQIQRTKPRTLAMAMNDSPLGLAAWMIEKWSAWGDSAGDPIARFGLDGLLTQVMLHWVAGSIGTSFLTYTAFALPPGPRPPAGSVTAPVGFYVSEAEPHGVPPRGLAQRQYQVARWSLIPRGGHFLPMEEPELFAEDLRELFRPLRVSLQRRAG
jgi:pimeloyl-ACP methyl ester carboxylesterase